MSDRPPVRLPDLEVLDWLQGEPIIDVSKLNHEQRVEALAPLSQFARECSLSRSDKGQRLEHMDVLMDALERSLELAPEAEEQRIAERTAHATRPLLTGSNIAASVAAAREQRRRAQQRRQVNVKLAPSEYAVLERAAQGAGIKPTQLARQLILNGTRRLVYEQRRRYGVR